MSDTEHEKFGQHHSHQAQGEKPSEGEHKQNEHGKPLSAASDEGFAHEEGEEGRPLERKHGARGTAAMDPQTRKEVARKGGLAVSRNRQHMSEIGRKGGQSVSKNREHMAKIGRKGGAASRGSGGEPESST